MPVVVKETGKLLPAQIVNGRTGEVVGALMVVCALAPIANKKSRVIRNIDFTPGNLVFHIGIPVWINVIVLIIEEV